jgi:CTD small phosphatase-like protein 2
VETPEGFYVKDLRVIRNRNLRDMVLVDNSVYSFGYQVDNGIPIISFYNDPEDEELLHLTFYMKCLVECNDVRLQNR